MPGSRTRQRRRRLTSQCRWPVSRDWLTCCNQAPERMTKSGSTPAETILVVEDEPAVRQLVAAALERAGYRVFEARDGERALSLFEANEADIDLLVTDLQGDLRLRISGHRSRSEPHGTLPRKAILEGRSAEQGSRSPRRSRVAGPGSGSRDPWSGIRQPQNLVARFLDH